jgi:hypothetical protein
VSLKIKFRFLAKLIIRLMYERNGTSEFGIGVESFLRGRTRGIFWRFKGRKIGQISRRLGRFKRRETCKICKSKIGCNGTKKNDI